MPLERSALERVNQIDKLIREGRCPSCRILAERFEVSSRTVERDIEFMRDRMGAPIKFDKDRKVYIYSEPGFVLTHVNLTAGEMVAVFLGQKLLVHYGGTPFDKQIRQAMEKIKRLLTDEVSIELEQFDQAVSFGTDPARGEADQVAVWFEALNEAIARREGVEILYYAPSTGEQTRRRVDPYHLHFREGAWYMIGYCRLREDFRLFALFRIGELTKTGEIFGRRADFDAKKFMASSWGLERGADPVEIAVRFDPYPARYIRERQWHESQKLQEMPDGSIILRVRISGLGEFKRWVMQFGPSAEVLEPAELRQEVAAEAGEMFRRYR